MDSRDATIQAYHVKALNQIAKSLTNRINFNRSYYIT